MKVLTVDNSTVDNSTSERPWLYSGGEDPTARRERIVSILSPSNKTDLWVNSKTLASYYKYLSKVLQLPFAAWYPEPKRFENPADYECSIIELLDPSEMLGDPFDGIYCRSVKDRYEINLPLVELSAPVDDVNYEALADYRHWFWNWRAP